MISRRRFSVKSIKISAAPSRRCAVVTVAVDSSCIARAAASTGAGRPNCWPWSSPLHTRWPCSRMRHGHSTVRTASSPKKNCQTWGWSKVTCVMMRPTIQDRSKSPGFAGSGWMTWSMVAVMPNDLRFCCSAANGWNLLLRNRRRWQQQARVRQQLLAKLALVSAAWMHRSSRRQVSDRLDAKFQGSHLAASDAHSSRSLVRLPWRNRVERGRYRTFRPAEHSAWAECFSPSSGCGPERQDRSGHARMVEAR